MEQLIQGGYSYSSSRDPGVAKSVTLKFISGIAPKGRYVAERNFRAGLTATVVRDEFLERWALEAGAMVLSNKELSV